MAILEGLVSLVAVAAEIGVYVVTALAEWTFWLLLVIGRFFVGLFQRRRPELPNRPSRRRFRGAKRRKIKREATNDESS
mgnify:CR=1 FL=1